MGKVSAALSPGSLLPKECRSCNALRKPTVRGECGAARNTGYDMVLGVIAIRA